MVKQSESKDAFEDLLYEIAEMVGMSFQHSQLRRIQSHVFVTHTFLESSMDFRIFFEAVLAHGKSTENEMKNVKKAILPILQYIPFSRKINIIHSYGDAPKGFFKNLKAVNDLRNVFAHPSGKYLQKHYVESKSAEANRARVYATLNNALISMKKYLDEQKNRQDDVADDDDMPF